MNQGYAESCLVATAVMQKLPASRELLITLRRRFLATVSSTETALYFLSNSPARRGDQLQRAMAAPGGGLPEGAQCIAINRSRWWQSTGAHVRAAHHIARGQGSRHWNVRA